MNKPECILSTEKGSVMVVALLVMAIVSVIGAMTLNQSTAEIQVASYDRAAKEAFYQAEGAAIQVAQQIEVETSENLKNRTATWLNDGEQDVDFSDDDQWTDEQTVASTELVARYGAVDQGVASGSSLLLSEPSNLHQFITYGKYNSISVKKLIAIEYRKRF